jgi:adenosylmethionine-8-amino-7-oxononanoate aminotransferase
VNKNHLAFQSKIKQHPKVETTRVLGTIFLEIKIEGAASYYGSLETNCMTF